MSNPVTVLIVDDDMRNVFAISQVLEEKGINVLKAANGKMALETLDKEIDIQMLKADCNKQSILASSFSGEL